MTTTLRQLLDEVADDQLHTQSVATRVRDEARQRRARGRSVGAAVLVAVMVVGLVVVGQREWWGAAPRPSDVASVPAVLPIPDGLETLAQAPMPAAALAYVVDDRLVLLPPEGGEPVVAEPLPQEDLVPSSVFLAPDGEHALVGFTGGASRHCCLRPLAYLLDVATVRWTPLAVQLPSAEARGGWLWPQLAAWSPDSAQVAFLGFEPVAGMVELGGSTSTETGVRVVRSDGTKVAWWPGDFSGVSWGAARLAARIDAFSGTWIALEPDGIHGLADLKEVARDATVLALHPDDLEQRAELSRGQLVVSSRNGEVSRALPGPLAALQPAVDGYVVVTWPSDASPGEPPPAQPLDVAFVGPAGTSTALTVLPAGTTSMAVASGLLTAPVAATP